MCLYGLKLKLEGGRCSIIGQFSMKTYRLIRIRTKNLSQVPLTNSAFEDFDSIQLELKLKLEDGRCMIIGKLSMRTCRLS